MRRALIILGALLLAAVGTGCDPNKTYAAKINGEEIPASVVENELRAITTNIAFSARLDAQLQSQSLGSLRSGGPNTVNTAYGSQLVYIRVLATLFDDEMKRLGLQLTDQQRAETEKSLRDNYEPAVFDSFPVSYRSYLVESQAQLQALIAQRTTPQAISDYYAQNADRFVEPCVRHIILPSERAAEEVRQRIATGEDFALIADAESIDSPVRDGGAPTGGALGCFPDAELARFVPPFRDAVRSLEVNELSAITRTNAGYHVIQVTSQRVIPVEEASETIRQEIRSGRTLFYDLLSSAKIEINPRFGRYIEGNDETRPPTPGRVVPVQPVALPPDTPPARSGSLGFGPADR